MLIFITINLPNARGALPCQVQNVTLSYPSSATLGEKINVLTHVQATCLQWPPGGGSAEYAVRVDLADATTHYILSTSTYQLEYTQTDIDTVLVNAATTP